MFIMLFKFFAVHFFIKIRKLKLRWLPTVSNKYYRIHFNFDLFDYFLFVELVKVKLGNSMFPQLEISETNKFCKFQLFPWHWP